MSKCAVYPGTFDPLTLAHIDLVERAASLFEHVIVAIAENPHKKPLFTTEERISLAKTVLSHVPQVTVLSFTGLLVDLAKEHQAQVILRGLRSVGDFDYEFQLARMNRDLAPWLETVFLTPREAYAFISSSLVREIASMHGSVDKFVPPVIAKALTEKFKHTRGK